MSLPERFCDETQSWGRKFGHATINQIRSAETLMLHDSMKVAFHWIFKIAISYTGFSRLPFMIYIYIHPTKITHHSKSHSQIVHATRKNVEPSTVADQDTTISSLRCITDADSAPRQRRLGLATSSVKGHSNHWAKHSETGFVKVPKGRHPSSCQNRKAEDFFERGYVSSENSAAKAGKNCGAGGAPRNGGWYLYGIRGECNQQT